MTKLISLRIKNYKAFEDTVFEPDSKGLTLIIGNNGSGKTSLWEVLSLLARLANGWQVPWLTRQFAGRGRNFLGCLPWHRADQEFSLQLHLRSDKPSRNGEIFYRVGWTANAETGEPQLTTEELHWDKTRLLAYDKTTGRYLKPSPVQWHFLERNYPLVLSTVGRQVLANTRFSAVKDAFDDIARWGVYRFRVLDLGKSLSDLDIGSGPRESLTVVGENLPLVLHAWKESPDQYPFAALRATIRVMLNRMGLEEVDWDVRTEVAGGTVYAFVRFFRTSGGKSDWFDLAYGPDGSRCELSFAVTDTHLLLASIDRCHATFRQWLFPGERIADADSPHHLAVAEIFGPQHVASQFRGGVNNHRVPELQCVTSSAPGANTFQAPNSRTRSAASSTERGSATFPVTVTKNSCRTCTLRHPVPASHSCASSCSPAAFFLPAEAS